MVGGLHEDACRIRNAIDTLGLKKIAGVTQVEDIRGNLVSFTVGTNYSAEIAKKLEVMHTKASRGGYQPDTSWVLQTKNEEEKTHLLAQHSEKQALAYALLHIPQDKDIKLYKNLRTCGDCHNFVKIISKEYHRVITMRDAKRWHVFKNGICSCGDKY